MTVPQNSLIACSQPEGGWLLRFRNNEYIVGYLWFSPGKTTPRGWFFVPYGRGAEKYMTAKARRAINAGRPRFDTAEEAANAAGHVPEKWIP